MNIKKEFYKDNKLIYKKIPLLSSLTKEEFSHMTSSFVLHQYDKGDTIFSSFDPADKMYIILDGFIKVSKIMSDGKEQILYIFEKGEFVGGHNILSGDNYEYSAYALKKTSVITINSTDINNILKNNNGFLLTMLQQSFERIRKAETLIDRLSVLSTETKVAKLLKTLISPYGKETEEGILLSLNITQEELGSLTGVSRETMSRKLSQFEDEGIIQIISRGKILIKDLDLLENYLI